MVKIAINSSVTFYCT